VGAVNADEHRSLGGQYGVQGFPTIKIFGLDKKKPEDYNGQRTAQVSVSLRRRSVRAYLPWAHVNNHFLNYLYI
jgi:protein disulfide-isomerase A6